MKILLLCTKSPYPPKEGGPIAMNAMIEGLIEQGQEVKVLAIDSWKFPVDISKIPVEYLKKTQFESVFVDLKINPCKAFLNLFTGKSYHIERFKSKAFEKKLIKILRKQKFDIIQLETLYLSPYINVIRKYSDAKIILRSHNIEHKIWERISCNCNNPLKKLYLNHLTKTLKKYEIDAINRYDGIACISSVDEEFYIKNNCNSPVRTIAFGIDLNKLQGYNTVSRFPGLFYIGSMNWMPNQEGIRWFLDNVWKKILQSHPELQFQLAGRNMPSWLTQRKYPNLNMVGEVENAYEFISSGSIMIVPLFSGSGIRIKIIEGMALGKTVISTKTGAEGIAHTNGENIIIADTVEEFVEAISNCINNKEKCKIIGVQAKELIKKQHDNRKIMTELISFYNKTLYN